MHLHYRLVRLKAWKRLPGTRCTLVLYFSRVHFAILNKSEINFNFQKKYLNKIQLTQWEVKIRIFTCINESQSSLKWLLCENRKGKNLSDFSVSPTSISPAAPQPGSPTIQCPCSAVMCVPAPTTEISRNHDFIVYKKSAFLIWLGTGSEFSFFTW